MTDNEIVRAFVCCHIEKQNCIDCPAIANDTDCVNIEKLFVDVFNRLQADKEALIAGQETLQAHISNQNKEISRLTLLAKLGEKRADDYRAMRDRALKAEAEIEKLKKAGEEAVSCFHRMESLYNIKRMELKVAKAEAIKDFSERLKDKAQPYEVTTAYADYVDIEAIEIEEIDNLIKEMVGNTDA